VEVLCPVWALAFASNNHRGEVLTVHKINIEKTDFSSLLQKLTGTDKTLCSFKIQRYNQLLVELEAVNKQIGYTYSEVDKLKLQNQLNSVTAEIRNCEQEINAYLMKVGGGDNATAKVSQLEQINNAILSSFDHDSFQQLLYLKLNRQLSHITGGGNFKKQVFDVINDAKRTGWLKDLVKASAESLPKNENFKKKLVEFIQGEGGLHPAISTYLEKVAMLEKDYAITFDANYKFSLKYQIMECYDNIIKLY
jgi:hypothetical protein